ncbi:peptide-N4-(N-acetyl-beta-glucosaminyl)asparagine amidase A-like protein [Carex littledalei]|uniref:Peptide-N4-(N-acetyl-beta-glucosaminyl)asparagine amidase A-like protein n=1 Tax=Carex littledalei TaxID=544730 RepID=A0A833QY87_9POAL|nr:peptide-N4-(N-acetyl-beta-glucosaminyl)asparagine amidase A-like protein [Carex littledalei]
MATCRLSLLPLFLLSLLPFSNCHLHRFKFTTSQLLASNANNSFSPTTFFEVTKPIPLPKTQPCSHLLLQHDFAYTYSKPPVTSSYTPPSCLARSPSRIVLEWHATCQGRQFDRIFGVWLGGVELLRSCTAEPRPNGIVWTVQKDVTKYTSLFYQNATFAVYLGNLVDSTYTGVYHVNVTVQFYFDQSSRDRWYGQHHVPAFSSPADLVLPISRTLPLNDGLWFPIQNSTDIQSKMVSIPSNTYRAVVEVYVSFHSDDEFWYTNPPDDYISQNNITGLPGNGAFREVTLRLDGNVVGAVWPFTVIYTGGINPLLWRPITGIGSFNLPSYDIEITPFLGKLLDGKPHKFGFGVTNSLDVWFVDANLHLWLDQKSQNTRGSLIKYDAPEYVPSVVSKFRGLDGKFKIEADRIISSAGWVESSYGKITSYFAQELHFLNLMRFKDNGTQQWVNQTIHALSSTYAKDLHTVVYTEQLEQYFPLNLYTGTADQVGDSYSFVSKVLLGFDQKRIIGEKGGLGFRFGSLTNLQTAQGNMKVKGNLVTSGVGSTQEVYKYEGTDGCYFRNVSSSNYTVLFDKSEDSCTKIGRWGVLNKSVPGRTFALGD